MSDNNRLNENDDRKLENKVKKNVSHYKRRKTKINLENLKYGIDEDSYYDIIDRIMENNND